MKRTFLILISGSLFLFCSEKRNDQTNTRPNILLIVADDAGFSDFSCYGSEISTPQIDAIAREGTLFTDFHVTPNCAPTRAALLTGMDNHLVGLGTMTELITENQVGKPGYEGFLNNRVLTLPEILDQSGYNTYMVGKWHLGAKRQEMWPYAKGFKRSFSMLAGGASHWADNKPLIPGKPSPYVYNDDVVEELPENFYSSKTYTDSLISFIKSDNENKQPFFAYLAFTAPHNPLHAPKEFIERYHGKYSDGWEKIANGRLKRMKEMELIPSAQEASPYPDWLIQWDLLSQEQQESRARDMEVYAAMISYMDMSIGRLISFLKSEGIYENTMILFISDNGASKTTLKDYASLGGEIEKHLGSFDNSNANKGLPNSAIDIGPAWAWACNTPFRLTKGYPTEGGTRVPLIIKMARGNINQSKKSEKFSYVSDLMPTILEVAQVKHPSITNTSQILPMQGISLLQELYQIQNTSSETQPQGFELYGMLNFRSGKWKIMKLPPPYGSGEWALYDLSNDLSEENDISDQFPEKLEEMIQGYSDYAKKNGIIIPDQPVGYAKPPKPGSY